jgi:hypothetical protein
MVNLILIAGWQTTDWALTAKDEPSLSTSGASWSRPRYALGWNHPGHWGTGVVRGGKLMYEKG